MSVIDFGTTVTLEQAAKLIVSNPDIRFLLEGEPGVGKSSILKTIQNMTGMEVARIDCANLDLGDTATPMPDRDTKTLTYYLNRAFKIHTGKPVAIMLDEYGKAKEGVKLALHPMLEVDCPRLGDVPLPEGSFVFLTGNLTTDGVGDTLKSHSVNRITRLRIRKPSAEQWITWALNEGTVDPVVIAFVDKNPHVMASYLDPGQADNLMIFHPKRPGMPFASGRSLFRASSIVRTRHINGPEPTLAALIGTVGEATARVLHSFIEFDDQIPRWQTIIDNPRTTPTPTTSGAQAVLVYGGIVRVTDSTITPFFEYLTRMGEEWVAIFCVNIAKNPAKQSVAFKCKAFSDWVAKNQDLL